MKIKGLQGEYAFKALIRPNSLCSWVLSEGYYFTQQEALQSSPNVIWPVEVQDGQVVYIPAQEELE